MAEQTESQIVIDAPAPAIMAVIADLRRYPEWSEGVRAVEVTAEQADGRPIEATLSIDSGPIKDTYELHYSWDGDESVSWSLRKAQLLTRLDGSYTLTPGETGTNVRYRLTVDVRMPMIGLLKRKAEKVIIDTALKGLKKRVEAAAGG
ncbi:MAG: SRPBCC family protein [Actinomycetota bacterium]|nr:MAG: SRPBCC family protein [Actinomycetota bacterium]